MNDDMIFSLLLLMAVSPNIFFIFAILLKDSFERRILASQGPTGLTILSKEPSWR